MCHLPGHFAEMFAARRGKLSSACSPTVRHPYQLSTTRLRLQKKLDDIITKAIEGGFSVDLAFLDLRKAFDSVPHHRLGIKLEAYGVKGKVLGWCLAFLSDRLQRVLMGEASSD